MSETKKIKWFIFHSPRGRIHVKWNADVVFFDGKEDQLIEFNYASIHSDSYVGDCSSWASYWLGKATDKKRVMFGHGHLNGAQQDAEQIIRSAWFLRDCDCSEMKIRFANWMIVDPWSIRIMEENGESIHRRKDVSELFGGYKRLGSKVECDEFYHSMPTVPFKIRRWIGSDKLPYRDHLYPFDESQPNRWEALRKSILFMKDRFSDERFSMCRNESNGYFNEIDWSRDHELLDAVDKLAARRGHFPDTVNQQAFQKAIQRRIRKKGLSKEAIKFLQTIAAAAAISKHKHDNITKPEIKNSRTRKSNPSRNRRMETSGPSAG